MLKARSKKKHHREHAVDGHKPKPRGDRPRRACGGRMRFAGDDPPDGINAIPETDALAPKELGDTTFGGTMTSPPAKTGLQPSPATAAGMQDWVRGASPGGRATMPIAGGKVPGK
jgi:hypothetical protein